ncbi:NAD(P)-dependent alcohol dehydrogenase [Glaciihabitans tibetensis]|uniref:NAD(P)-dependent alcohol dehydrogenase n=1 Tax=Glaciihabitans tibetensis TaxID=1266600 RepID=UPI001FEC7EB0|nr:NAD(P)-dependent alcohol dehydrogenase [Glaciihabitans tibetensis]
MPKNIGYAATDAKTPLAPFPFDRREVGAEDVRIDIKFCGICHSDIHQARDEWGNALATNYPCMPGHEIAGIVADVGDKVTTFAVGDRVGVGCMIYWGSDDQRGGTDEQYQNPPAVFTYNSPDAETGEVTFGGYSDEIVVNQHFVLNIPDSIPLEKAAPLLCAGVTTWSPLKHWNIGPGSVVAVAGIGGLGHLAVQLAKALGATVTALTTTEEKTDEILALGADEVVVMSNEDAVKAHAATFDLVLSTIPTAFDMNPYLALVKHDGAFVTVGMLEPSEPIDFALVTLMRITLAGSAIGSIAETQEVLDFCAANGIASDIELVAADQINAAFEKVIANDARFRYVIDNSTLPAAV